MNFSLSPNTQAILLLTAPLIAGRNEQSLDLLKPNEYKKVARYLRDIKRQPSDFLGSDAGELIRSCRHIIDTTRVERLIGRGFLLSQVVEQWRARSIWVISRADPQYPKRLKQALREDAPAVLYGCGNVNLLDRGGLAVVGPRRAESPLLKYANDIGQLCASAQKMVISGGAKGVDLAAMDGAQLAGGVVCNVMAENLEKAAINRSNREHILNQKLVLVSAYDPKAGFNVGHAMQRNKLIYGLSQAALVVDATANKGGTWAGAYEQLNTLNLVPIYVRSTGSASKGLDALLAKGAIPWPNPSSSEEISEVLNNAQIPKASRSMQMTGSLFDNLEEIGDTVTKAEQHNKPTKQNFSERLYSVVQSVLIEMLEQPMSDKEVAHELNVSKSQAASWLEEMVRQEKLTKLTRPVRFKVKNQG
ncbi:TPA: DNA-processing protein DprA [Vibrio parahaemolyticus]|uniref:DNA-processing protein DprA n=1 Tax=Vibrio parahaemolyticus TaxID=670 RepID=UPI00111D14EB|nr:DNA-processing protein DprA [Vibrio parahaemolyticus]EGR0298036.1 DNA-processing protein DprA [Vibrio parahaemolyticus]TNZ91669.1 DNA protecting protein DprA [Vibrio parahaemolyticus]